MHYALMMVENNLNTPNVDAIKNQLRQHYMHYPLIMVEVNLNTPNENATKDQLQ
ncbi:hypothetical protein [Alloprevotella tannerae]|uniref:hypothetical protein n=1 Tax=Alloprevotella tannerae TaxID=76122 RepID=UPI0028EF232D|nr:hypothetical protein [Alloprevotella tannerae]